MNKADKEGVAKLTLGGGILATVAALAFWVNSIQPVFDKQMCRVGEADLGHVVIVSDISETQDGASLIDLVRTWRDKLPMYYRLSVYTIGDLTQKPATADPKLWPLVPVFEACNPGRGDQVNVLIRGSLPAEGAYQEYFAVPLKAAVEQSASTAGAKTSPILAALEQTRQLFVDSTAIDKVLVIRSDFLEATGQLTHYGPLRGVEESLAKLSLNAPDFAGVHVQAIYIERPMYARRQTSAHEEFWQDYFALGGAANALESIAEGESVDSLLALRWPNDSDEAGTDVSAIHAY